MLLPHLVGHLDAAHAGTDESSGDGPRVRVRDRSLTYAQLATSAAHLASDLPVTGRLAVVADRELETIVVIVAGLLRGTTLVPVNPSASPRELDHVLGDSQPVALAVPPGAASDWAQRNEGSVALRALPRIVVDLDALQARGPTAAVPATPEPEVPGLVMYTSGTTGPPKGAVLSHRAIAANLDMLAQVWGWTAQDVLVHALPLYHVHGLVLGVLGALRVGSGLHHLGDFDPTATAAALAGGATMHFGVPTIYHRLADAAGTDAEVAAALAGARLLVSGSAGLPTPVHERIRALTGHTIVERYGMTETMITTAVPAGVTTKAGTVGPALPGVDLRVVDETDREVDADGAAMGEVVVRTPAMFSGYLGALSAPAADEWFHTGDTATIDADGYVRIVGRSSVDIIKSGGFKIGAGEIEDVLLEHPAVAECAVRGVADDELGERVVAWVVLRGDAPLPRADAPMILIEHARAQLSRHKQPRELIVVDSLPRNAMGKVQKARLESPTA